MGDEPPQLEAGVYGDDPKCSLLGSGGGLEGAEGVQRGDEVAPVCGSLKMY